MSNTNIAAYRTDQHAELVELLQKERPDWRVSVNASWFDFDANIRVVYNTKAIIVWIHPAIDASPLYKVAGSHLGCWWVEVFFQEHISWEYILYHGAEFIHQFIPRPEIWGRSDAKLGDVQELAKAWSVDAKRVERYIRRWDEKLKFKKAYFWKDEFRYKQFEQGFDFVRALTGLDFPSV